MPATPSFVVTGGAQGVGAAIVRRPAVEGHVGVLDPAERLDVAHERVRLVTGDAGDPTDAAHAADVAAEAGPLAGWVNNAAVFRDASLSTAGAEEVLELVTANLRLAITGCQVAIGRFLAAGTGGSIVNVSSHQAQRAVRGALPYATAKAAVEGLTRAAAVDHGPDGVRVNAVALGSISTDRYEQYRSEHPEVDAQMAALHPLGRVGRSAEVADVVAFLLSDASAFVNGAVVPVDGGRAAQGADPEAL